MTFMYNIYLSSTQAGLYFEPMKILNIFHFFSSKIDEILGLSLYIVWPLGHFIPVIYGLQNNNFHTVIFSFFCL